MRESLAAALDELLTGPALRGRFGEAGRAAYERGFRLERTIEETVRVYRAIMDA